MWSFAAPWLQKERRLLENRRLDLDICKARLKKAKQAEAKAAVRAPHSHSGGSAKIIFKKNKISFFDNIISLITIFYDINL